MSCPAGAGQAERAGSLAWQGAGRVATFADQSCRTSAFPGLLLTLLRPAEWIRPLRGWDPSKASSASAVTAEWVEGSPDT